MSSALPFTMTPEAADYVRSRLRDREEGRKPCLVRGLGYADGLSDDVYFEGEHFQIIYEKLADPAEQVELLGERVVIAGDTLKRLANRMLVLHTIPRPSGAKYVLLSP